MYGVTGGWREGVGGLLYWLYCVHFLGQRMWRKVVAAAASLDKTRAGQRWRHVQHPTNNPLSTTMPSSLECVTVRIPRETSLCGSQTYRPLTRRVCGILRAWMACIPRGLIPGVYLHPSLPCQRHNASVGAALMVLMAAAFLKAERNVFLVGAEIL